jgi:hypothetical protein
MSHTLEQQRPRRVLRLDAAGRLAAAQAIRRHQKGQEGTIADFVLEDLLRRQRRGGRRG